MSLPESKAGVPTAPASPPRGRRWLRGMAALGLALAAFAIAGFFAAPALVGSMVTKYAEQELKRKASIGEIRLNPFTLRLEVRDFSLSEGDGRPIAAFAALVADLDWSSLTRRAWHLAEFHLVEPRIRLDIAPDGRINLAELAADLTRNSPREDSSGLPRMVIDTLVIDRGRAELTDRHAGYENTVSPFDVRFENLSTLPQDRGPYSFSARTAKGGSVRWKGEVSLNPLVASGEISAEGISLPGLSAYLKPYTTAELVDGKAGFVLPYRASYQGGKIEATVTGAAASLDTLAIRASGSKEPLFTLKSLRVLRLSGDLAKRDLAVGELLLDDGKVRATRDANGSIDLFALTRPPASSHGVSAPATADPGTRTGAPWTLKIDRIGIDHLALSYEDRRATKGVSASIGRVQASAGMEARVGGEAGATIRNLEVGAHDARIAVNTANAVRIGSIGIGGGEVDLATRRATAARVTIDDGQVNVARDAEGSIDLLRLLEVSSARANNPAPKAAAPNGPVRSDAPWTVKIGELALDKFALGYEDRTATKPLSVAIGRLRIQGGIEARSGVAAGVTVRQLGVGLQGLRLGSGDSVPVQVGDIALSGGEMDLAGRRFAAARLTLRDGQLKVERDKQGRIDLLDLVPGAGAASQAPATARQRAEKAWTASIGAVDLERIKLDAKDDDSGVALGVRDFSAQVGNLTTDAGRPLSFNANFALVEGGRIAVRGRANPSKSSAEATLKIDKLSLKPIQPLLGRHIRLKLVDGALSTTGTLGLASPGGQAPRLRYVGAADVTDLRLDEESGTHFGSWKSLGAEQLTLTLQPNRLQVPELRVVDLDAKLLIESDRSLNASRLLVTPPPDANRPTPTPVNAAEPTAEPFRLDVRRLRVQNAKLDFSDQSLRPQFAARIHELNGVVTGLSTVRTTRSQLELDGRVDEFGLARIRGEFNPFVPRNNTDVSVVFRNVDLVSASPYAMKFAGYRIASGKISLDLNYIVRNSRLEGQNKVVLEKLTLGERVQSPDALDLPLEFALAVLTDSEGRIDLDLPVSGNLDDPQFSYGAVIWKAITNVITKIVTAPFRALGALLGVSGDKLESVDFDPGSARLQPPEREKLKQVAGILAKRTQLKVSVQGSYNESADGLALRVDAVRNEIGRRAGIKLAEGESAGPPDLRDRSVHEALRAMLTEREGVAAWDARKSEAESGAKAAGATITVLQRAQRLARGNPQVADLAPFYHGILDRLIQTQRLDPNALMRLATQRADAVVGELKASGIAIARVTQTSPGPADMSAGKAVPLNLGLSSH